ncbi:Paired amphipathic helix protein Sin3a [Homalodisca vitripennis]|nr:Paired amphipathic helix protein Sin3a [Homalodisca vitripennis]
MCLENIFQEQPDKYKRCLEILQTYQNEQQKLKEGAGPGSQSTDNKQMTSAEMYSQGAQLFEDHDNLLAEFVQFLPDATDLQKQLARHYEESSLLNQKRAQNVKMSLTINNMSATSMCTESSAKKLLKRSPSMTLYQNSTSTCQRTTYHPPAKKHKRGTSFWDISLRTVFVWVEGGRIQEW